MDLKMFFEQFDTIAEAPGGIQRLRNLILDMAVRGKLVPQDPNDEPANQLLQKIQAEIKQKASKRKKTKNQSSEILPFSLPQGWVSASLDDISIEVHYGLTASANHENTDIKFLRITDIQNDSVNWLSVPGCNVEKEKAEKYRLKNTDIVIARTGGTVGKSYLVESLSDDDFAVFASYLIRVIPSAEVNPHYLKLTMGTSLYWEQLSDNTTGTGQPNVNATSLKSFILPLPPIAEQKRIVAKVDELMGLCDQFEAEKQKRDSLRQRLRASAFAALMNAPTDDALSTAWSFIHQHWHPLTQHPDDVEDMRQAFLQLSVFGKIKQPHAHKRCELTNSVAKSTLTMWSLTMSAIAPS
jgi:restriction endonuclease S subunit